MKLAALPKDEVEKLVMYFNECIDDRMEEGLPEQDAVAAMGNLDDICRDLLNDSPPQTHQENGNENTNRLYTEKNFTSAQVITAVEIEDFNLTVNIETSADDQTQVQYFENIKDWYTITITEQGVLRIKKQTDNKWSSIFSNLLPQNLYLSVRLPQQFNGNINVNNRNGGVSFKKMTAAKITVNTTNGCIYLVSIVAIGISLNTTNGKIDFSSVIARNQITVNTTNGKVNFFSIVAQKQISVNTTNGKINFSSVIADDHILLNTTNAKINLESLKTPTNVTCNTTNAQITVCKTDCNKLDLHSSNGEICVSQQTTFKSMLCVTSNSNIQSELCGQLSDYNIQAKTTRGTVKPQNITGGPIAIQAQTSNGDITWRFMDISIPDR